MELNPPLITVYYRTIDNITNKEIDGYTLLTNHSNLNFGKIGGIDGGESPYVVELDIWNNEPSFYGGVYTADVADAIDCKFTAWDNEKLNSTMSIKNLLDNKSYILARCVSKGFPEFKYIAGNAGLTSFNLSGSDNNNVSTISGQHGGDHMKIQTKIFIPPQTKASSINFVFNFNYNYV
jgi:hypothetical protein